MISFLPLLLVTINLVNLTSAANLLAIEAGIRNPKKIVLSNDFELCPTTFSTTGISVICEGSDLTKPVSFFVNDDKVRNENVAPYTIAGDRAGKSARCHHFLYLPDIWRGSSHWKIPMHFHSCRSGRTATTADTATGDTDAAATSQFYRQNPSDRGGCQKSQIEGSIQRLWVLPILFLQYRYLRKMWRFRFIRSSIVFCQ